MIQTEQRDRVPRYRPLAELVPTHWLPGSLAAGTRLHCTRIEESQPAVLCLHGVQGSGLSWLRTARRSPTAAKGFVVGPVVKVAAQGARWTLG